MKKLLLLISLALLSIGTAQTPISSSSELVQALSNGGTYTLAAGSYELSEKIIVTNDLSLTGAGLNETHIISSTPLALIVVDGAENIYFEGINFEYQGSEGSDVVDIKDAKFEIINSRFAGGVYSEPAEDDEDGLYYGSGLYLYGSAEGSISNSIFENNQQDGVHLEQEARVTISDSVFNKNHGAIAAFDATQVTATNNEIRNNGGPDNLSAVYAEGSAVLGLNDSQLENNSGGSVFILGTAYLSASGNTVNSSGTEYAAFTAGEEATMAVTNNQFNQNEAGAIYAYGKAVLQVSNNIFTDNDTDDPDLSLLSAVTLAGEVQADLVENQFGQNEGGAIYAYDTTVLTLTKNIFTANSTSNPDLTLYSAVSIAGESQADLVENQFIRNLGGALYSYENAKLTASNNIFKGNGGEDADVVVVSDNAEISLTENTFNANLSASFAAFENSKSTLTRNTLEKNTYWVTVYLSDSSSSELKNNSISDNEGSGVVITDNAAATLSSNTISYNAEDGVVAYLNAKPRLTINTISQNSLAGIYISDDVVAYLAGNQVNANETSGMVLYGNAFATLSENSFSDNTRSGLGFLENSGGRIQNNTIRNNQWNGIVVADAANPKLEQNILTDNVLRGILFVDTARGSALSNTIQGSIHGIFLTTDAEPLVSDNVFSNNETNSERGELESTNDD